MDKKFKWRGNLAHTARVSKNIPAQSMNTDVLMSKYEQNEDHMQQQYFIVLTAYTTI